MIRYRIQKSSGSLVTLAASRNAAIPLIVALATLLSACGGGSDTGGSTVAPVTTPSIGASPQNVTVTSGQPATFSVSATGTALVFQWKRGGTAIAGATAASFTIAATVASDSGASFTVDVSNSAGSATSTAAILTVNVPAAIAAQPQNTAVASGQAATFTVAASGTTPLTYQWKKNGQPIIGATAAALTLSPATAGDHGASFLVTVTNVAGAVNSNPATLSISPPIAVLAGRLGGPGNLDGPTATARIGLAGGLALDATGNVVFVDSQFNKIRELSGGVVSTLAGTGNIGSADGPALSAQFNMAVGTLGGVAYDANGNLYVADSGNSLIRKITPAGVVSTLAGVANTTGLTDGAGSLALFNHPSNLVVGADSNLYVTDAGNNAIRRVTLAGVVTTVAGGGAAGFADGLGTAATFNSPSGIATTCQPVSLCLVGPNNSLSLWVTDTNNNTLRKIQIAGVSGSQTATVSTVAGLAGVAGSADGTGTAARFSHPSGVAFDGTNVYVADTGNATIRYVAGSVVTTFAGVAGQHGIVDGLGSPARFLNPLALAISYNPSVGDVVLVRDGPTLRQVTVGGPVLPGNVTTLVGSAAPTGLADGTGAAAKFNNPTALAADFTGNTFVVDSLVGGSGVIRKVSPIGVVTTLVQNSTALAYSFDITVDPNGLLWVAGGLGGLQTVTAAGVVTPFSGTIAPGTAAVFTSPSAVSSDSAGTIYVFDSCTVFKITTAHVVSALAGSSQCGYVDGTGGAAQFTAFSPSLAVDTAGNVFVSDPTIQVVRKVTASGVVTTLAGSPNTPGFIDAVGSAAKFKNPAQLAVDAGGNVYVADSGNSLIRRISPSGIVTTVVGKAGSVGIQPGALPGSLNGPQGIAVLPGSNVSLVIADSVERSLVTASLP